MCAGAIDDEIERPFGASVACDQARRVHVLDLGDVETEHEFGAGGGEAVLQGLKKDRAVQAEPLRLLVELHIAQVHDGAAARRPAVEPFDRRTPLLHPVEDAEPLQRELAGRLQQQAGAHRLGFGETLEDRYVMAVARKRNGRRLTGDAATNDADAQTNPPERARPRYYADKGRM